jgi:single-stranded-DNA-specific exonuclease
MKKQWNIHRPDDEKVKAIQRHLDCSSITATILCNRKIESPQSATDFLSSSLHNLTSPDTIQDMDPATERIERALLCKEKMLIIGDYDVDGVAATVMLFSFLKRIGAKVVYHIPHRINEGYGLSDRHIHKIALPMGIKLIITVDNGSASYNAVKTANASGMDVIITDHHRIPAILPEALAVVNPKRMDCGSNLEYLSGVGVAFYLLICLRKRLRERGFWRKKKEPNLKSWCDLVALGTIADMVPMIADNRILTKTGIDLINRSPRPGISALIKSSFKSSKIDNLSINAEDIAFRLAPRLNAAGRMEHANSAVELLLAPNFTIAQSLSDKLDYLNGLRKDTENTIIKSIELMLAKPSYKNQKSIAIGKEGWHEGVLGIVAARISNRFIKPTIVFSEKNGRAKGSARSIPGLDIYAAISACKKDLIKFGGHASAAGLTLKSADLTCFKEQFENTIGNMTDASHFIEKITIDCEVFFENIDPTLLDELEVLQPFGQDNPAPLFMAKNIEILSATLLGQSHRRMILRQQGNARKRLQAIQFNVDPGEKLPEKLNQMAFRLRWNHWNGSRKIQLVVEET